MKQTLSRGVAVEPFLNSQMVRDLADQFTAMDASAATMNTIDVMMASHGIATTETP